MEGIKEFLQKRAAGHLLRALRPVEKRRNGRVTIDGKTYADFSSNDYLGLSGHPHLVAAAHKAARDFGVSSSASRLMSGSLKLHQQLEETTAAFKQKEAALVFNSGYQANIGIISSLCGPGDCIFVDRLSHASIIDGIMLSRARFFRFEHNDVGHLEELLKKERAKGKNALVITETIFSMDGDRAPLEDIVRLKERYNATLMVDEAHATGIFGKRGSGVVEEDGLSDRVDIIMGTFSKALGSFGAYCAASRAIVDYLINTCRSFIYSTALPAPVIAANCAALEIIEKEPQRRKSLLNEAQYVRTALQKCGMAIRGASQIIPVMAGDTALAVGYAEALQKKGYWVLPVRPPTVPKGEARLRFSLTYHQSHALLTRLLKDIQKAYGR